MTIRRRAVAALAAIAVLGATAPAALAADPSPSAPDGLYGTSDPQYDGVWRQSLALLAQDAAGVRPAESAVGWLTGTQCQDGAFPSFRADTDADCDADVPVDTNSTAAAVQALTALGGHEEATARAVDWLRAAQNADGGWGYTPESASEPNSTSLVIGALTVTGHDPDQVVRAGHSPYDALAASALPCGGDTRGAFGFPDQDGEPVPNADATAAGVLGALGGTLVAEPGAEASEPGCEDGEPTRERIAANGAAHLLEETAEEGVLMSALGGAEPRPDYGNTADAVVALAAQGGAALAEEPLRRLREDGPDWAAESGPAAWAQLILAAHAAGGDPRDFGGVDLVARLNATGPEPLADGADTTSDAAAGEADDQASGESDSSGLGVWWSIGLCLVAVVGVGLLIGGRLRKRRP
ncbi:prenyltransferase/squalene oxidase repeat-containing protein [Streptomyces sp. WMMC905]|uniref:prenyltransferase/squalene oxidase repeat-containing protein n=1 Tax=Streptomyces sp. WMMC905 TaxID=3404123 RepID=UPI003B93891D